MAAVYPSENSYIQALLGRNGKYPDVMALDKIPEEGTPEVPAKAPYEAPLVDPYKVLEELTLCQCARNGDTEKARLLLETERGKAAVNNDDIEGLTPLHYAARYNHFTLVELLVLEGADVNREDNEHLTPLMYACRIKRRRLKSRKSMVQLGSTETPRFSQSTLVKLGGKKIDTDANAIHFLVESGADIRQKDAYGMTALHHAALRGDEVACEQLLLYNTDKQSLVHVKDVQEMTALHTAVCQSNHDIVRQLLAAGADVRSRDNEMSTALHEAATLGDTKIGKLIFESCQTPEAKSELLDDRDEDGNTSLMLAVQSGKYNFVSFMIKRGAPINVQNKMLVTPLHLAAIKGDLRIVELLVERGAQVGVLTHDQQTPLHKACLYNNCECIKFLLDSGSNIEARDMDNFSPLLLAAVYGHANAVKMLIERGADVTVEDKNDKTVVFLAAEENKLDVLQVLTANRGTRDLIDHRDEENNSPLHIAARHGHINIVKCLMENGAMISLKNDMEQTPMHMAAEHGWIGVVREIAGKDKNSLNDGDENSNTALHLAADGGHIQLVKTLIKLGADHEIRNGSLRTAMGCAAANGHMKVVIHLVNADTPIDPIDKLGLTPLLVAAANGHADVVDFLLERKADVGRVDMFGHNCLDLAVMHDHQEVAMEIIKSPSWEAALRNATLEQGVLCTPLRRLIKKMPEAADRVFEKCIEVRRPEEGSTTHLTDQYEVMYNFEFLDDMYSVTTWAGMVGNQKKRRKKPEKEGSVKEEDNTWLSWNKLKPFKRRDRTLVPYTQDSGLFKSNHPMMIMVDSHRLELLDHPLVTALRRHKWTMFGRFSYYVTFLAYAIFLFFLTGYVIVTPPPFSIGETCEEYYEKGEKQHLFASIGKYFILVLAVINIIKELFQLFHNRLAYISWENFLEVWLFISSFLFVLDYHSCQNSTGFRYVWQWNFGAIAIVLCWIGLVMFIQKFPKIGIYVVMFNSILRTFFEFFIVFLLFIIAFGFGFFVLIQNQTPFATPYHAIIRTSVMMIGEFDYNDIFHSDTDDMHYWLTYVIFCVFLLVMTIIIMNLLVGLAVDDIKGVHDEASLKRIAMKVNLVLDVERVHLKFTSRWWKNSHSEFYRSMEEVAVATKHPEQFENQIQKSQAKMLKKMDKLKGSVRTVIDRTTRIEEMLEALVRAHAKDTSADTAATRESFDDVLR
ncbi:transient receptor potential cation channel subfamily A member 1 homolog isoform X1 [Mya arenaria]|uniref:transient receptor potential cation channel subfamily A member 1 homolog isoform X1 n=1 Tax=Mya arenaria TaxID=6604 RepID=UPI0022E1124D|nr:transient receptor potential cation channel subfamily A member 1 homolog isoform X1 [Mya arenaria]